MKIVDRYCAGRFVHVRLDAFSIIHEMVNSHSIDRPDQILEA